LSSAIPKSADALALQDVTCIFTSQGSRPDYTAVRDATLSLADGEFVALVGPTGCGKSTLLNVAAGLLSATAGETYVFGERLSGLNRHAGYMFQADSLLPWLTALGNVSLGLEFRGMARRDAEARAHDWLQRVGLSAHALKYPHELSGGMKKRASMAQVFVTNPRILLMDEPYSALDVQTRQMMENELLSLWAEHRKSVLFVTHDLEEAISLADRVVVLSAGPATRPIASFDVDIPRPRDVTEIVHSQDYLRIHSMIWDTLKHEVLQSYKASRPEAK
jgi:NitT/TauT family transport system ATP-binding protein